MKLHPATLTAPFRGYPPGAKFLVGIEWEAGRCMLFADAECGPRFVARVPLPPDTRTLFVLT